MMGEGRLPSRLARGPGKLMGRVSKTALGKGCVSEESCRGLVQRPWGTPSTEAFAQQGGCSCRPLHPRVTRGWDGREPMEEVLAAQEAPGRRLPGAGAGPPHMARPGQGEGGRGPGANSGLAAPQGLLGSSSF